MLDCRRSGGRQAGAGGELGVLHAVARCGVSGALGSARPPAPCHPHRQGLAGSGCAELDSGSVQQQGHSNGCALCSQEEQRRKVGPSVLRATTAFKAAGSTREQCEQSSTRWGAKVAGATH